MTLPKEIEKAILKFAVDKRDEMDRIIKPGVSEESRAMFLTGYLDGLSTGATEWAGKAILPDAIESKVDEAAQQYESATPHVGVGPAIFKAGVNYAMAYARVTEQEKAQGLVEALEAFVEYQGALMPNWPIVVKARKALAACKGKEGENEGL
jgi:hypothetical protein